MSICSRFPNCPLSPKLLGIRLLATKAVRRDVGSRSRPPSIGRQYDDQTGAPSKLGDMDLRRGAPDLQYRRATSYLHAETKRGYGQCGARLSSDYYLSTKEQTATTVAVLVFIPSSNWRPIFRRFLVEMNLQDHLVAFLVVLFLGE